MAKAGYVYILKDKHFKRGVKIGKAQDVERRMRPMWTANPWLSVYVKIKTSKWRELETAVHNVIKLVAKSKQVGNSEFFVIAPEKARALLMTFRRVIGKEDFEVIEGEDMSWKEKGTKTKGHFICTSCGADAKAVRGKNGRLTVLKGSKVSKRVQTGLSGYLKLRKELGRKGVIRGRLFISDYTFSAPSPAAAVVIGSPTANGLIHWKTPAGKRLKEV